MDSVAAALVGGLVAFTILLVGGLLIAKRREARRVEQARAAPVVHVPLAGPMLNRRTVAWLVPMVAVSLAAGALTSRRGPIPASNAWFAIAFGVVLIVCAVGASVSAVRKIGVLELDRAANRLRVQVNGRDRTFDLGDAFEYEEFRIFPKKLVPNGGSGVVIRQNGVMASFWYWNDFLELKNDGPPWADAPPEELRCTDRRGRLVHEHLRQGTRSSRR